jgi:hypothetical protein
MNANPETSLPNAAAGQLLHLGERHLVAIYTREGVCWVAEFRDGRGELIDPATFFHFHTGALRYSHGRRAAALASATALTPEVLEKIERLHQSSNARDDKMLNVSVAVVESLMRYCREVASRISGQAKGAGRLS